MVGYPLCSGVCVGGGGIEAGSKISMHVLNLIFKLTNTGTAKVSRQEKILPLNPFSHVKFFVCMKFHYFANFEVFCKNF